MSGHYTLDAEHRPVPAKNWQQWIAWLIEHRDNPREIDPEGIDDCRVGSTRRGDVWVSTTFVPMDLAPWGPPPTLFETLVFGGPQDGLCERARTWEEAVEMHSRVCGEVFGDSDG